MKEKKERRTKNEALYKERIKYMTILFVICLIISIFALVCFILSGVSLIKYVQITNNVLKRRRIKLKEKRKKEKKNYLKIVI